MVKIIQALLFNKLIMFDKSISLPILLSSTGCPIDSDEDAASWVIKPTTISYQPYRQ